MNAAMRGTVKATVLVVSSIVALAFVIESMKPTQAMPPFAQAYGINCEVCHENIPALNAYGRYVQRTGYASLDPGVIHSVNPLWVQEAATTDTQNPDFPGKLIFGNLNVQAAGYIGSDITVHAQQWIVSGNEPGFTDTLWLTYNNLFHRDSHLTVGKYEVPAPSPFSMWFELSAFAPPNITVGEHVWELQSNRWGAKLNYVRPGYIVEAGYGGPGGDLNTAFDFTTPTDKTFQYRVAYARPDKPFEAGVYGATGSWPLSDGTYDQYSSITPYVEMDPQHGWPGLFAMWATNHDNNAAPGVGPVSSGGYTVDVFEPFLESKVMLGARYEGTYDALGDLNHYGYIDIGAMLSRHVATNNANALMLNAEVNMVSGSTAPGWRAQLLWNTTVGNMKGLSR
ncbi:MAG: hypothetical protein JO219_09930 [Candidatus Eremiobacteraeota bacterium]|nr:hypothetical protein [Candidatus Eremiobacteraeota bacterium]